MLWRRADNRRIGRWMARRQARSSSWRRGGEARRSVCCYVFFFQAEDGIRDLTVTGVQTCALPIWRILILICFLLPLSEVSSLAISRDAAAYTRNWSASLRSKQQQCEPLISRSGRTTLRNSRRGWPCMSLVAAKRYLSL